MKSRDTLHFVIPQDEHCPPVPGSDVMTASDENARLHSNVTLTCVAGYTFRDGDNYKVISCEDDLTWTSLNGSACGGNQ